MQKSNGIFREKVRNIYNITVYNIGFINRTSWTADASQNPSNAWKALEGDLGTKWDTSTKQARGQWFRVDMGKETEFNCVVLSFSESSGDALAEYEFVLLNDEEN